MRSFTQGSFGLSIAAGAIWLLLAGAAFGTVYKWRLPDGSIEYSDTPSDPAAVRVDLPQIQIYSAPPAPVAKERDEPSGEAAERFEGYETIKIVLPAADATFRDHGGTIPVQASVSPPLHSEHRVEMLFDGKVVGASLSVTLRGVVRGSHSVAVVIKDPSGAVVAKSAPVRFHVKRTFKKR